MVVFDAEVGDTKNVLGIRESHSVIAATTTMNVVRYVRWWVAQNSTIINLEIAPNEESVSPRSAPFSFLFCSPKRGGMQKSSEKILTNKYMIVFHNFGQNLLVG